MYCVSPPHNCYPSTNTCCLVMKTAYFALFDRWPHHYLHAFWCRYLQLSRVQWPPRQQQYTHLFRLMGLLLSGDANTYKMVGRIASYTVQWNARALTVKCSVLWMVHASHVQAVHSSPLILQNSWISITCLVNICILSLSSLNEETYSKSWLIDESTSAQLKSKCVLSPFVSLPGNHWNNNWKWTILKGKTQIYLAYLEPSIQVWLYSSYSGLFQELKSAGRYLG